MSPKEPVKINTVGNGGWIIVTDNQRFAKSCKHYQCNIQILSYLHNNVCRVNQFAPALKASNRKLLQSQLSLDCGFGNVQVFMATTCLRIGWLSDSMYVTRLLVKQSFPALPIIGSLLLYVVNDNMQYHVISIVHHTPYAALYKVNCRIYGSWYPLPWPSFSWKTNNLNQLSKMVTENIIFLEAYI